MWDLPASLLLEWLRPPLSRKRETRTNAGTNPVKSAQKSHPYQHGIAVCPQNAPNRALSLASAENARIHLAKFVFCLTSTHTHEQV